MSGYRRAKVTIDCFILESSHDVVYLSTNGGDFDFVDGLFGSIGVTEHPLPDCVTIEHLPDVPTFTDGDVVNWKGWIGQRKDGFWRWLDEDHGACRDDAVARAVARGDAVRLTPEVTA